MQTHKNLNNVSDEVKKLIPAMQEGEVVVFQMLNGHPNNDPDRNERERNPVLYGKTQLSTRFKIKDPKNGVVEVGLPMGVDGEDRVTSYRAFLPGKEDSIFLGKFQLRAGNIEDEELFEILWISPEREGSPFADKKVQPVFKIVNQKAESEKAITKVDILRKALNILKDLNEAQISDFAASQNWSGDPDYLKGKISEFAKSNPDAFLKAHSDPNLKLKSDLKNAIEREIVKVDPTTRKVTVGESELFTIAKDDVAEPLKAVANWVNSAKNGKEIYDGILKQLKDK